MPTTKTGNRDRQDWLAVLFSKYDLVPKKKRGKKKKKGGDIDPFLNQRILF